jgi:endoglucanase
LYDATELLAKLSEAHGPSGYEDEVRKLIVAEASRHANRVEVDALGSVFAEVKGRSDRPRIMVSAHMDEVGFIVTYVEESGFLRFATLGTLDPRILPGQRVIVKGCEKTVGVIGSKPPHGSTLEEMKVPFDLSELYIDIGASSRDEVNNLGIDIGRAATFDTHFSRTSSSSVVIGKAFDNRGGCTAALMLMEMLMQNPPTATTIFAFTVQEELGMRGAMVAANRVLPDVALVFETTAALDCPGVEPPRRLLNMGRGPALRIMDRSVITQIEMLNFMKDTAKANGIPYQLHISLGAANEAGPIHLSGKGVPTGVLSTPCRYLHGPALMLSIDDLMLLPKLAEAVIRGIGKPDQFAFKVV